MHSERDSKTNQRLSSVEKIYFRFNCNATFGIHGAKIDLTPSETIAALMSYFFWRCKQISRGSGDTQATAHLNFTNEIIECHVRISLDLETRPNIHIEFPYLLCQTSQWLAGDEERQCNIDIEIPVDTQGKISGLTETQLD